MIEMPYCAGCKSPILNNAVRDMQSVDLLWHVSCLAEGITKNAAEGNPVNTFSDEDLAQFKKDFTDGLGWWKRGAQTEKVLALIARLEAAERIVNAIEPDEVAQVRENFIAWRKAAGK